MECSLPHKSMNGPPSQNCSGTGLVEFIDQKNGLGKKPRILFIPLLFEFFLQHDRKRVNKNIFKFN